MRVECVVVSKNIVAFFNAGSGHSPPTIPQIYLFLLVVRTLLYECLCGKKKQFIYYFLTWFFSTLSDFYVSFTGRRKVYQSFFFQHIYLNI